MTTGKALQILGYGTFFDFPRGLFVRVGDRVAYLVCEFDEATDEYCDRYQVFIVTDATPDDFTSGVAHTRGFKQEFDAEVRILS